MKTAYLLLVHDQPALTAQIIQALSDDNSSVFIHVDKKSNEADFKNALDDIPHSGNIHFVKQRVYCLWGRFTLVEATLNLLREAYNHDGGFNHFVLLSGRDYPIKSTACINSFLEKNKGIDFLEYYELPDKRLFEGQDGIYRVNRYHYHNGKRHKEFPPYSKKPILNPLFNAAAKFYHSAIRKMPLNMKLYAGSQWWMLCRQTVKEVLDLLEENKSIERFFENVWIPDELFFQTLILHLKKEEQDIVNNNYRHISWQVEANSRFIHAPIILTKNNFGELANSEAFFARKFDVEESKELIKEIDKELLLQPVN